MIYKMMWNVYKRWLKADANMAGAAASKASKAGLEDAALQFNHESEVLLSQLRRMAKIEEEYNV